MKSIDEMKAELKEAGYKVSLSGYAGDNYEVWSCYAPDGSMLFTKPALVETGNDKALHRKLTIERAYTHLKKERQFATQAEEVESLNEAVKNKDMRIILYQAEILQLKALIQKAMQVAERKANLDQFYTSSGDFMQIYYTLEDGIKKDAE